MSNEWKPISELPEGWTWCEVRGLIFVRDDPDARTFCFLFRDNRVMSSGYGIWPARYDSVAMPVEFRIANEPEDPQPERKR